MHTTETVEKLIMGLKLIVEIIAALIILAGVVDAFIYAVKILLKTKGTDITRLRIRFSKYLLLALEFQLAADVLGTSVAPTWDQLGKLATVAVIRTFLNYFLNKEIKEEEEQVKEQEKQE